MAIAVRVNTRPLDNLRGALRAGSADPAFGAAYRQWDRAYLAFAQNRYSQQEGGGWRPLAASTQRQRVRQGYPGPSPILRRSGEVKNALREGAPGNLLQLLPNGVRIGYGGNAAHSPYAGQTTPPPSIAQIAAWHNTGTSRMPRREIIVPPDPATVANGMIPPLRSAVQQILTR